MTRYAAQSGLTLPEVLILVAVLAAIAAALAPSVRATSRAALAMQETALQHEELRTSRDLLQRLTTTTIWAGSETPELHALGNATFFRFGTYDPSGYPAIAELKATGDGIILTLSLLMNANESPMTTSLLQDIEDIRFSYFGSLRHRTEPDWHQLWQRAKPPQLLRITGRWSDTDKPEPFILDIPLAGQAPLVCDFDPVSRLCRNAV